MTSKLVIQNIAVQKRDYRPQSVMYRLPLTPTAKLLVMGETVWAPSLVDNRWAGEVLEDRLCRVT